MLSRRDLFALSAASVLPAGLHPRFAWAFADDDDPTRVFTGKEKPTDVRLGPPKTLNDYFPFIPPKTKEAWEARRKQLREQLLVATGLWPMPEKTPLNAVVHGKIERDGVTVGKTHFAGYTIEKVSFASMPGHYVTGNLYRPKPIGEPFLYPGVLFAHGHWAKGRFEVATDKEAEASLKSGGEPDRDRAKYFMQAIPATLARLGFVVFQYDMVGYADSTAIPHREGFRDAEAELRLQSQMGLQTWNSVRALDFITSLPDVDPKKIGMTGASGGGTQTFMLAALDDRLACAFPAVMVSTGMQGGCVCENCSLLRVNTGNVEIAALFAPKPMAFSAANDWTKEFMTKGYPELQELYKLYGTVNKVDARVWLEYGHQYNVHARQFMYQWMLRHLAKHEFVKEPPFKPVPPKELLVYDDKHPRPKDEFDAAKLRAVMTKTSDEQIAKLTPKDAESLKEFQRVVGTALRAMVNSDIPLGDRTIVVTMTSCKWPEGYTGMKGIITRASHTQDSQHLIADPKDKNDEIGRRPWSLYRSGEAVPFCTSRKDLKEDEEIKGFVVWIHPKGKASLYDKGKWNPAVNTILAAGYLIVAIDTLWTGESVSTKPSAVDKGYAGYTYGYNRSLLAQRVHDTLTAIRHARGHEEKNSRTIHLVGWDEMGVVALLAKALAGDKVAKTAADLNQFRFENIRDTADPMMLPGAVKYGGLPAFLALCAPGEVLAHNHKGTATGKLPKAAYDAAGAADKLTRSERKLDDAKVVEWLLK